MLHLIKLAVGVGDPDALTARLAERSQHVGVHDGKPFIRTRSFPRRAPEILDGGSIYWVMSGVLLCRQRVADIVNDQRDDGTPCTAILLELPVVPVMPRAVRAFQGWRYLTPADAPADLGDRAVAHGDVLPPALRRELAALCLL